jgi:hypothetical protein
VKGCPQCCQWSLLAVGVDTLSEKDEYGTWSSVSTNTRESKE